MKAVKEIEDIIKKSFQMGYEACPKLKSSPYLNADFMKIVPNCELGDDEMVKLRIKMYKAYIKGWTEGLIDKVFNVN